MIKEVNTYSTIYSKICDCKEKQTAIRHHLTTAMLEIGAINIICYMLLLIYTASHMKVEKNDTLMLHYYAC